MEGIPQWSDDDISYVGTLYIPAPVINKAPIFNPFIEPVTFESTGDENEKFEVYFPATVDPEGTKVTLSITSALPPFVIFTGTKLELNGPIKVGLYVLDVEIRDEDNKSTSWKQKITIVKKEVAQEEPPKVDEV
jgi:hypothetical protein